MAARKRSDARREHDLKQTVGMIRRGATQTEAASALGLSQQQISHDLRGVRAEWRAQTFQEVDKLVQEELEKLQLLETQYLEGWRDSRTNGPGNWQFLHGVLGVIKLRSELLGLFPARTNRGEVDSTGVLAQSFRKALLQFAY